MKHSPECLIYLLNRNKNYGVNGEVKSSKSMLINTGYLNLLGGAVASWLVRSTPERAVRVRALPGTVCCVLGQDTLLSQCLSPPRCINGYLLFVGET